MNPAIKNAILSLRNKIRTMIQRVVVTKSNPVVTGQYPIVQVESLGGKIGNIENISPYGLASSGPLGALGIKFNIQGESANQVGLVYDPSTLPGLAAAGEAAVGGFSATIPTYFKFTHEGKIEIWKAGTIVVPDLIDYILTHP